MPDATSVHTRSVRPAGNSINGSPPVCAAMRRDRDTQSEADGRSTSVGGETTVSRVGGNGERCSDRGRSMALHLA